MTDTWDFDRAKLLLGELRAEFPEAVDVEAREVDDLNYHLVVRVPGYEIPAPVLKALHRAVGAYTARWEGESDGSHVWIIKNDD